MSASPLNPEKTKVRRRYDSHGGRTVSPESPNGRSYMESVYSLFHELSQAYKQNSTDERESIVWAKFFSFSHVFGYEEIDHHLSPMLLALGYSNGIQLWNLSSNDEAVEMFSLREGPVKTVCILPPPKPSEYEDILQKDRPLIAICIAADSKEVFASVSIRSLKSGDQVNRLTFDSDVVNIEAGPSSIMLISLKESIHIFCTRTMNKVLELNSCHPGPSFNPNPFAVGKRWLAYSPYSLLANLQSAGGVTSDDGHSYVATALSAVKTIGKGISTFSDTVNWLASKSHLTSSSEDGMTSSSRDRLWNANKSSGEGSEKRGGDNALPGRVTILDLKKILSMEKNDGTTKLSLEDCDNPKAVVVAHFVAHLHHPVAKLEFGPAGRLLATADDQGHTFHIFSIFSHPTSSQLSAVHHLYSLCRGDTLAQVQELRFSWDSRWLCASTLRGTCHIFPITPYGGTPTVRTHATNRMVNRSSRFHKSAGLDDIEYSDPKPRTSQLIADGTALAQGVLGWKTNYRSVSARSSTHNPRYPPLPHPVLVQALVHVRPGTTNSVASTLPGVIPTQTPFLTQSNDGSNPSGPKPMEIVISTRFLETRKNGTELRQVASNGSSSDRPPSAGSQRLLIASSSGFLTEYLLEPRPHHDKVANDSPVELIATPCVCWPLQRHTTWNTVPLSLSPRSPLISYTEKCRDYYEKRKIRRRPDPIENMNPSLNGFEAPPTNGVIDRNGSVTHKVCSEQPKSRIRNSLRNKAPGGAVAQSELAKKEDLNTENHYVIGEPNSAKVDKNEAFFPRGEEWLSQVEMVTHEGPARRLWMGPQFHFKPLQSTGSTHVISHASSALLSGELHPADQFGHNGFPAGGIEDAFNEELDLASLQLQSRRSDPVPTPNSRLTDGCTDHDGIGCCSTMSGITIEAGSGNFDRSAHMLEISAYGSVEDRRYSSFGGRMGEEKLKERIADAMADLIRGGRAGVDFSSHTPPDSSNNSFSSITPPSLKLGGTRSDTGDFGIPLVTEHFDFTANHK